ncbi:Sodium:alanine symporter [Sulfurovum sp. enrichment culture clone C5]|uniref:Sodium:alanine symporter n=1 Tax=Sulfurovum sp. enrichment culture clone C5 TaxID=497650 RepID=A0A0S4XN36_9BACT|nr:Sodium:alanine symporter [Sulfurovum sp. enrichment culture clone C5]
MNEFFVQFTSFLDSALFFDIFFGSVEGTKVPFVVALLIFGGVYLTLKFNFVNLKMFAHSYKIIMGKYRTKDDVGIIEPRQSLTTALSATVGLGNIAGVAIAIAVGGPGATFWMIVAGFLGMTLKFTEVTLSLKYREFLPDGTIIGGGMGYLKKGFTEKGYPKLGKALAVVFAIFLIGAAIGGGNTFQVSQALGAVSNEISFFKEYPWVFGVVIAFLTGFVIIGGVKRIAHTTEKIVPLMVGVYMLAGIFVLIANMDKIPLALQEIFVGAFAPTAVAGGVVGVIVQGFQRAAFSSEAGIGSAPIAHSTARVKYPVRQGMVALYEPFIDTVIVCTTTALVIVTTNVCDPSGSFCALIDARNGSALTAEAFRTVIWWFPAILSFSIFMFAFSTLIAWSYYGEIAWVYLFGVKSVMVYKIIYLFFVVLATVVSMGTMVDFSTVLFLALAIPNIFGLIVMSTDVKNMLNDYLQKLKSGELDREALK